MNARWPSCDTRQPASPRSPSAVTVTPSAGRSPRRTAPTRRRSALPWWGFACALFVLPIESPSLGESVFVDVQCESKRVTASLTSVPDRRLTSVLERLFVRAGGSQSNHHQLRPVDGSFVIEPHAEVDIQTAPLTMVGVDLPARIERATAGEWRSRLGEHQLELPSEATAATQVRVQTSHSAITLVRALDAGGGALATSKTGQRAQLRALADPTSLPLQSDLPLRAYVDGAAARAATITVYPPAPRTPFTLTTDDAGMTHFQLDRAGTWRVGLLHVVQLDDDAEADYHVASASLSFVANVEEDDR